MMTESQFKAWLWVKLSNLGGVCREDRMTPDKLLSRLSDITGEAERRAQTIRKKAPR
jgi:hypothetical protein